MRHWFSLCLLLGALLFIPVSIAQEIITIDPALTEQMDEIEQTTSDIRGLELLEPVERRFPSREAVQAYLRDTLDSSLPEDEIQRYVQFYAAFELLPPDIDLRNVYLELLGSQVAGYYDPETEQMNTIMISGDVPEDKLPLLEQVIYAHEFTHALQDQHFDLRGIGLDPDTPVEEFDRTLALSSLVEGDATLAMTLYLQQATLDNPLAALSVLTQSLQGGGLFMPPDTPPILIEELVFPYNNGLTFVTELYGRGGWAAVDQAYIDLPQSSEQILHPQRYLDGDMPQEVELQPTSDALGDGWEILWDTRLGEFYLRSYLKTQIPLAQASQAAAGWGGDRFHIYYHAQNDQLAWVIRLVWDTPEDAAEFSEAFDDFGAARFDEQARTGDCWSNADDALCLSGNGEDIVVSFAPTKTLAQALLDSQQ